MVTFAPPANHAARMDRMYRYQRFIYDLTRKYYLLGRDRAIAEIAAKPGESILELGCGTGRNLAVVSRLYPQSRLYGLDISEEMLRSARKATGQDACLVAGDASEFSAGDFGKSGFDHVLISYALSMIPRWQETIACAAAALNPGGTLHIVDFGQQEGLPGIFRGLLRAWLARFHVTPRKNMLAVVESVAKRHGADCTFRSHYRGYAWSILLRKTNR